jgi:hypothetical protein
VQLHRFLMLWKRESELRRLSDQLMENEHRLVDDHIDIAGIKYARDALDQMDQVFGIFMRYPTPVRKK